MSSTLNGCTAGVEKSVWQKWNKIKLTFLIHGIVLSSVCNTKRMANGKKFRRELCDTYGWTHLNRVGKYYILLLLCFGEEEKKNENLSSHFDMDNILSARNGIRGTLTNKKIIIGFCLKQTINHFSLNQKLIFHKSDRQIVTIKPFINSKRFNKTCEMVLIERNWEIAIWPDARIKMSFATWLFRKLKSSCGCQWNKT